ncbi:MAG: alanine racemase, partial [Planctomycetes bacterium]|nr:alanine racemase [Planctomycetota bacterium]
MNINEIAKPTLLVDIKRVRANIKRMAEKAKHNNITFRPHFKTHQSAEIGEIFRKYGVDKITVTSVEMAEYFAKFGWTDITIAMPVNLREIDNINKLSSKISLSLIVDSEFASKFLSENIISNVNIWIEINAGYNR